MRSVIFFISHVVSTFYANMANVCQTQAMFLQFLENISNSISQLPDIARKWLSTQNKYRKEEIITLLLEKFCTLAS